MHELQWWIDTWDTMLRNGQYCNPDIPELLNLDPAAEISYEERRWQEARAQVVRILQETRIKDLDFFKNRIVMEVGPGPVGFLEACDARIKIGIEPLANAFREHGLLLPDRDVVYINSCAEKIPLNNNFVDISVTRNSLDHVEDPKLVIDEIWRVLKPNGYMLLNVDIGHEKRPLEPHSFSTTDIDNMLTRFTVERKIVYDKSHGGEGQMYVALCIKP